MTDEDIDSRALDLFSRIKMDGLMNRRLSALSGGQRRKVELVVSLLNHPELLVLDEPTTGIDIGAKRSLYQLIGEHIAAGGAVILTSHDMEETDKLSDLIGVLVRGKLAEVGTSRELKEQHGSGYTARLSSRSIGDMQPVEEFLTRHEDVSVDLKAVGTLHVGFSRSMKLADGLRYLMEAKEKFPDLSWSVSESSLVPVFVHFAKAQDKSVVIDFDAD